MEAITVLSLTVTTCIVLALSFAFPVEHSNVKIFGGKIAEPGQFPFIVSINIKGFGHWCGGSIINENWIVTAAHCAYEGSESFFEILTGTNLIDTGGVSYNISQFVVHESYNSTVHRDDIALAKIDGAFTFSDLVQTIEIGEVSGNESVIVAGWGATEEDDYPNQLEYAELTALTDEDCTKKSEGGMFIFPRGPGQVCALAGKGISPCYGDSGGPLIFNGTLVGLVSYGVEPCANGFPDVYTRVAYYVDWINEHVGKKSGSVVGPEELCAFGGQGVWLCLGDVGDPLVFNGVLVGFASWSIRGGCGIGVPDVYTRVSFYQDWIEEIVERN